jgi:hypothetical protein
MVAMEKIRITKAGEGEHLQVIADVVTIKAFGEATSGKMLMLENTVPQAVVHQRCTVIIMRRFSTFLTANLK